MNKSELIRQLHSKGISTPLISKITGIRYNMVYNVVERYTVHKNYMAPAKLLKDTSKEEVITAVGEVSKELVAQIDIPKVWKDD